MPCSFFQLPWIAYFTDCPISHFWKISEKTKDVQHKCNFHGKIVRLQWSWFIHWKFLYWHLELFFLFPLPFGLHDIVDSSMYILKQISSFQKLFGICSPLLLIPPWFQWCHETPSVATATISGVWRELWWLQVCTAPLFFPVSSQRHLLFHSIFQVVLLTRLTNFVPYKCLSL